MRRPEKSRGSRGNPAWRSASPRAKRRSQPTIGSSSGTVSARRSALGEIPHRIVGGQGGQGGLACLSGVVDGLARVCWLAGAEPVVGQFIHPPAGFWRRSPQSPRPPSDGPGLVESQADPDTACAASKRARSCSAPVPPEPLARARCRWQHRGCRARPPGRESVTASSKSKSKSRPMTAAMERTRPASSPSRRTRAEMTSRTLSGSTISDISAAAVQRPRSS